MLLQSKNFDVAGAKNGTSTVAGTTAGESVGVSGFITKIFCTIPGVAVPPGRYYVRVFLSPSAVYYGAPVSNLIYSGYLGSVPESVPNTWVSAGKDYLYCVIVGGSNGATTDIIRCFYEISDMPVPGIAFHQQPGTGPGERFTVSIAAPAAGSQMSYTVPSNVRQRFKVYAGSVAVANSGSARPFSLTISNPTPAVVWTLPTAFVGTLAINATDPTQADELGVDTPSLATPLLAPLNPGPWPAGYLLKTAIGSLVAGDQVNASTLEVEEWAMPLP